MSFATLSKQNIELLLPYVDKFIQEKKSFTHKKILKSLYKKYLISLKESDITSKIQYNSGSVYHNVIPTEKTKQIINKTYIDSIFVSQSVRSHIQHKITQLLHYQFYVNTKQINVYIGLYNTKNIAKYETYIKRIIHLFHFLENVTTIKCSYPLTIYLFPTIKHKKIPNNSLEILQYEHVNSAVTTNCNPSGNSILIYRNDEWFKVLIHELFHSLNMDFSYLDTQELHRNIKTIFKINTDIRSAEAYSEFWANIINCLFCSYNLMDDNDTFEDFYIYNELCGTIEKIFSIFQMIKVLHHMNLGYKDLYTSDITKVSFKQKTNVFSYYVLKTVLLYHSEDFMLWCYYNNKPNSFIFTPSKHNLDKFLSFIREKYTNKKFQNSILDITDLFTELLTKKKNKKITKEELQLLTTMNMTICEL